MYSLPITPEHKNYKKLLTRVRSRIELARRGRADQTTKWKEAEERMLAYLPETELDAKRRATREAGNPDYTTIQIPYSYAMVMTAHTYLASVFLSRSPIHQYQGADGEAEMNVTALEALIGYQVQMGRMLAPYYIWLYDTLKYGVGIIGTYWEKKIINYSSFDGSTLTTRQFAGYEGNKVYNVSPFDFLHDPRVTVGEFQRGEFLVIQKNVPWHEFLSRETQGYYVKGSSFRIKGSGRRQQNGQADASDQLSRPDDFELSSDENVKHPAIVHVYEVYVTLVPSEWGLGPSTAPEKWCFTLTQDFALLFGVAPLGLFHDEYPFDVAEVEIEAYGQFNRGMPETMAPLQNTIDWLVNSHFFNVRAALNNQFIVDPSRVVLKNFEKSGPGIMFRLRPEAYGTDPRLAIHQMPVADVTGGHLGNVDAMFGIGERVFGVTSSLMGLGAQKSHISATDTRTSAGFATNRLKTIAEYISATSFAPHSTRLVQTSQQFYDAQKMMRIVGDTAQFANQKFINVDPESITGFFSYVPVDGTLPVDRFAMATLIKEVMGQVYQIPQLAQQMDWMKLFGYLLQIVGVKNFNQFKVQVAPDAALAAGAAAGNSVPVPTSGPGAASMAGINAVTSSMGQGGPAAMGG